MLEVKLSELAFFGGLDSWRTERWSHSTFRALSIL